MAKLKSHGTILLQFVHEYVSESNCKVKITDYIMSDRAILTKTNYRPIDGTPFGGEIKCKRDKRGEPSKIAIKVSDEDIIKTYLKAGFIQE